MNRTHKSLSALALVVLTLALTSCGLFGGSDNDAEKPQSVISIDTSSQSVEKQHINIQLGDLDTWRVKVNVTYPGDNCLKAGMGTSVISDGKAAQKLDLGDGINDTACLSYDDAQTKSFVSTLVPGEYYVTLYGKKAPVTITVTKTSGKKGGSTVTDN